MKKTSKTKIKKRVKKLIKNTPKLHSGALAASKYSNDEDSCGFSLDGTVYFWEIKNGKCTETPMDGELILKCLINMVSQALDIYEQTEIQSRSE